MKKIVVISSFLVLLMFLVACAPKVSDEKLEAGLSNLSDDDLDVVINETSKGNANALAGQAVLKLIPPTIKVGVSNSRLLASAQAIKIKRLEEKIALLEKGSTIQPPDPQQPPDPAKESTPSTPGEEEGIVIVNG